MTPPPFSASAYALLLDMHRFSAPIALDRMVPRLDRRLGELANHMLAKKPAERPSMDEVAHTLERILTTSAAVPPPVAKKKSRLDGLKLPDVGTPSPMPAPKPERRRTEPMEQLSDASLAAAAVSLLHDSETMPVSRLEDEPTADLSRNAAQPPAEIHYEPTSEFSATSADDVITAVRQADKHHPPGSQSHPTARPRRRRQRRRQALRREQLVAILVAILAIVWAVAAIVR